MDWRIAAASAIGTSHVANGTPNQDRAWVSTETMPDGSTLLLAVVADGAGSARYGGNGAAISVETVVSFVQSKAANSPLCDLLGTGCLSAVRTRLAEAAYEGSFPERDLACTLLAVVSSPQGAIAMQIGDGAIVVDAGQGLELAIQPMRGEYANATHFVIDADWLTRLTTRTWDAPLTHVALMSDGVEHLAIHAGSMTPHPPFFVSLFSTLAASPADAREALESSLSAMLASETFTSRTDDDKTLVLAVLSVPPA